MPTNRLIVLSFLLLGSAALAIPILRYRGRAATPYARFDSDEINAGLDRKIPLLRFQGSALPSAWFDKLASQAHARIDVDWRALTATLDNAVPIEMDLQL